MAKARWTLADNGVKVRFCPHCGTILELPEDFSRPVVQCSFCPFNRLVDDQDAREILTQHRVAPLDGPEADKAKKPASGDDANRSATVETDCPQCGRGKAYFRTAQLRSADEGQTIFYECCKCSWKWSENT